MDVFSFALVFFVCFSFEQLNEWFNLQTHCTQSWNNFIISHQSFCFVLFPCWLLFSLIVYPKQENDLNDVINCQYISTPKPYLNRFSSIAFTYRFKCLHHDEHNVLTLNGTSLNFHTSIPYKLTSQNCFFFILKFVLGAFWSLKTSTMALKISSSVLVSRESAYW